MLVVDIRTQHETADWAAGYKLSVLLSCAPSLQQLLGDSTKKRMYTLHANCLLKATTHRMNLFSPGLSQTA